MKKQSGFTLIELLGTIIVIIVVWGWIWNIVKIVDSNFDPIISLIILRCVGVFVAPLDAVLGFI